ncbi:MAG: winged helix-turn-helix transcriptional regulator [Candidatus Paceibacterota bacterium]
METGALAIFTLVVLIGCVLLLVRNRGLRDELRRTEKERREEEESFERLGGLEEYHAERQRVKDERKNAILTLFESKKKIKNVDVTSALDVSSATATRYLDELEEEGRIQQNGTTGRSVVYVAVK